MDESAELAWPHVLDSLIAGADLTEDQAADVMSRIMAGDVDPAMIAALLVAIRAKGESAAEIAGFVRAMLDAAAKIDIAPELSQRLVDIVGTGGDGAGTFNISTVASVVVAAAGHPVAKHGNRAASSQCGSADLLEAWGVAIDLPPEGVATTIHELGIGFLFARSFHPAMRVVAPVRAQLGVPTTFNILGPLANPAGAPFRAVGVASARLAPVMAEALAKLGVTALVFRGRDGVDELTTTGPSDLWEVRDGTVKHAVFDPADADLVVSTADDLRGGDAVRNAEIANAILGGAQGPAADVVALNAGAALYAAGAASSIGEGVALARERLRDGSARDLRDTWVARTRELASEADETS